MRLEPATIAYNVIEGVVASSAGLAAGSVALVGFGFDSGIEVAAASVVLWRLCADIRGGEVEEAHNDALRLIAVTFFVLAGYVLVEGMRDLVTGAAPDSSAVGIALTGASIIIMPALAWAKARAGQATNSRLVVADAAETQLYAWLSVSTFAGLVAFAAFGWTWIDAVAGFVIAGFAINEGREPGKANSPAMTDHARPGAEADSHVDALRGSCDG